MNNIMEVHKLSINLDINRYIEYTLMYIGYECVGYVFIYTLMYSCIKPYKWEPLYESHTHEGIRNLSPVSSISLALLFFYFITRYQHEALLDFQEIY